VVAYFGFANGSASDYYYTDIDACGFNWLELPDDGVGSYNLWIVTYDDADPNILYLATCGQPMLWGTGDAEFPIPDDTDRGEASTQGPIQWDDVDPVDAWHVAPDECYDYTTLFDVCPEPLGAMVAFYVDACSDCPGDVDGDCDTDLSDFGILLAAWNSSPGDPNWDPRADLSGDGAVG
jgi:hypothetical protein